MLPSQGYQEQSIDFIKLNKTKLVTDTDEIQGKVIAVCLAMATVACWDFLETILPTAGEETLIFASTTHRTSGKENKRIASRAAIVVISVFCGIPDYADSVTVHQSQRRRTTRTGTVIVSNLVWHWTEQYVDVFWNVHFSDPRRKNEFSPPLLIDEPQFC